MDLDRIRLPESWKAKLAPEFDEPYMAELRAFLVEEMQRGAAVFPEPSLWFNALNTTSLDQVKVVILGQDPYPTPGHAHGLCFSVQSGVALPKSLRNIYKELEDDVGIKNRGGCLQAWAEQGVLLLNSVLTVRRGEPASHQGKGWERFTDRVIDVLNTEQNGLVFLLWGAQARKKGAQVDTSRHTVLEAPHPSPLSAHRGFFGSKPFSTINAKLEQQGKPPIDWSVPD